MDADRGVHGPRSSGVRRGDAAARQGCRGAARGREDERVEQGKLVCPRGHCGRRPGGAIPLTSVSAAAPLLPRRGGVAVAVVCLVDARLDGSFAELARCQRVAAMALLYFAVLRGSILARNRR